MQNQKKLEEPGVSSGAATVQGPHRGVAMEAGSPKRNGFHSGDCSALPVTRHIGTTFMRDDDS